MALMCCSCSSAATARLLLTSLLLLMATLINAQTTGNLSNAPTAPVDVSLPEGLTVLVAGEQNTIEVAWETTANSNISNVTYVLLLTRQPNGEQIAYREVGGGEMEGRVSLSGVQLGEDYSLTVYSSDGRLGSIRSEALTLNIQTGEGAMHVHTYIQYVPTIL